MERMKEVKKDGVVEEHEREDGIDEAHEENRRAVKGEDGKEEGG